MRKLSEFRGGTQNADRTLVGTSEEGFGDGAEERTADEIVVGRADEDQVGLVCTSAGDALGDVLGDLDSGMDVGRFI